MDPRRAEEADGDPWTRLEPLPGPPRGDVAIGVLHRRLHVLGGADQEGRPLARHDCYDPRSGEWRQLAELPLPRAQLGAGAVHGRLFAIGGIAHGRIFGGNHTVVRNVDEYLPDGDRWIRRRALPNHRYAMGVAEASGQLYVIGGMASVGAALGYRPSASMLAYAPGRDEWLSQPAMAVPRMHPQVAVVDDRILVVDGTDGGQHIVSTGEEYAAQSQIWSDVSSLRLDRRFPGVAAYEGRLYAIGGESSDGGPIDLVEYCTVASEFFVHRYERGKA